MIYISYLKRFGAVQKNRIIDTKDFFHVGFDKEAVEKSAAAAAAEKESWKAYPAVEISTEKLPPFFVWG